MRTEGGLGARLTGAGVDTYMRDKDLAFYGSSCLDSHAIVKSSRDNSGEKHRGSSKPERSHIHVCD